MHRDVMNGLRIPGDWGLEVGMLILLFILLLGALGVGYGVSLLGAAPTRNLAELVWTPAHYRAFGFKVNWTPRYLILAGWFLLLLALLTQF
jgi:hypothetical protein